MTLGRRNGQGTLGISGTSRADRLAYDIASRVSEVQVNLKTPEGGVTAWWTGIKCQPLFETAARGIAALRTAKTASGNAADNNYAFAQ